MQLEEAKKMLKEALGLIEDNVTTIKNKNNESHRNTHRKVQSHHKNY